MEKRRSERVHHKLEAKAIVGDKIYNGYIENLSREGILKITPYEESNIAIPAYTETPEETRTANMISIVTSPL